MEYHVMLTHIPLDKMAPILAEDIFNCIYLNENVRILIQISLQFVPNGPAFVQAMAWHQAGNKPLPEAMMTQFIGTYMQH